MKPRIRMFNCDVPFILDHADEFAALCVFWHKIYEGGSRTDLTEAAGRESPIADSGRRFPEMRRSGMRLECPAG